MECPTEVIRYNNQYTAQLASRYLEAWNYKKDLKEIEAPLLVVYGEQDTLACISHQEIWLRGRRPDNADHRQISQRWIECFIE